MAGHPVVAPTVVRIGLNHNLGNGRHATVVIDLSVDEGVAGNRTTAVANAALATGQAWQDKIMTIASNALSYTGGQYTDLDSLAATSGSFGPAAGHPVNGGAASATCPPNVAMLVTKHCAHSRAQRPGRMYVPGVIENQVSDQGDISSTQLAGNQTAFNLLLAQLQGSLISGATTAWRVVHVNGHDGVVAPGFPNGHPNSWSSSDVTALTCQTRVATQRRRNRG